LTSVEPYSVFVDESALKDRFFAYGGIFLPSSSIDTAEGAPEELAHRVGFGNRALSWRNCSRREVDRYVEFAAKLWDLHDVADVEFRSLLIDTHRHPLKDPQFGCTTEEEGILQVLSLLRGSEASSGHAIGNACVGQ
jgi:hypothetical protein